MSTEQLIKLRRGYQRAGFDRVAKSGNEVAWLERVNKYLAELGIPTSGERPVRSVYLKNITCWLMNVLITLQFRVLEVILMRKEPHG